jgi:hypothetical protein
MDLAQIHETSYTAAGMQGGWWQYYVNLAPGGYFDIVYLGSYYANPTAAAAAFTDVDANLGYYGTVSSCQSGDQCIQAIVTMTFPDGQYRGIYRIVQTSNTIGEFQSIVPVDDWSSLEPQVRSNLDRASTSFQQLVARAGTGTPVPPTAVATATVAPAATSAPTATSVPAATSIPSPTPTATAVPISFTVLAARFEKFGSSMDTDLNRAPMRQAHAGTTVYLSLYGTLRSAPANAPVTFDFTLTQGGKVLKHKTVTATASAIPTDTFRASTKAKLTKPGKVTLTARMTVNDQSQERTATLKVVK